MRIRRKTPSIGQTADVPLENDCTDDRENVFDRYPLLLAFYEELNSRIVPSANLDTVDAERPCHFSTSTMRANGGTSSPYASLQSDESVSRKNT